MSERDDPQEALYGKSRSNEVIEAIVQEGIAFMRAVGLTHISVETVAELTRQAAELETHMKHVGHKLSPDAHAFLSNYVETLKTVAALGRAQGVNVKPISLEGL